MLRPSVFLRERISAFSSKLMNRPFSWLSTRRNFLREIMSNPVHGEYRITPRRKKL
jgi:hypothetical protein